YYGMRALLILFMTKTAAQGGLGFPTSKAGAIYGLYTAMVFLLSVPGGWIADRITGQRRAVLWGGIVIALGHFSMAVPRLETFYLGLGLIVLGTGLLKPNISTMVGALYTRDDARRDGGFSIFYMGINIGALLAPLVCGYLGENINWHYGFGAAGVGMTLGVVQYAYGAKFLGAAGTGISGSPKDFRLFKRLLVASVVLSVIGGAAAVAGWMAFSAEAVSNAFGVALALIVVGLFGWLLSSKEYTPLERRHVWAILVLFLAAALFWSAFEQAGSTLNLFADRNTNLHAWDFSAWGLFRASYYQSFNSLFIIALAPVFAWYWVRLGKRGPSSTAKFSWGLLFVGLGFAVLIPVANSTNVSPWWLTLVYLLHTIGELCLSPVGLSAMTRLAPARAVGMMMGVWFLADSVGNFVGGRLASVYETFPLPLLFGAVAGFCVALAIVLVFLIRPMKHLSEGVN
ncbi:MAG: peptide MFS transporter, partial [Acidobacteriota bacterium]|nr:peptide MFS transporter [Acidobacteriota bacterium]